ncbi:ABC transporter substrate-binding protein [Sphingomonas sp. LHG3406-1]|uniref:ABC transporter substrate-binding protein n=1 Tax=Sphingomonas sp. LHG3406-1 TaxID=2804617 RepID=UPI00260BD72E|nr:ABC transporter substrate-binding protein [Sphingomonas sp. LHG3406-1]
MRGFRTWAGGKAAATLLLVAVLAPVASCRDSASGEAVVTVIADRLPSLADPTTASLTPADLLLVDNVAQGLVRFDAAGDVAPALAERWAVSDDGLSYVFRLQNAEWSDGRRVRARDIVRLIKRQLARRDGDPLRDSIGAVREVVAMTDRVIAIELSAPRPHFLQLLAQPQFGLVREGRGSGPFRYRREGEALILDRTLPGFDGDESSEERVRLTAASAKDAVDAFVDGRTEMVIGGTVADVPVALGARLPRGSLRFDPVAGLFGLVPARRDGIAADREARALLDAAIDRDALVAALGVPGLQSRASLLQTGLDGYGAPAQPAWAATPFAERRPALVQIADRLFPAQPAPAPAERSGGEAAAAEQAEAAVAPAPAFRAAVRVDLPAGPGGDIILQRLKTDWAPLGLAVEDARGARNADFRWIDAVAPSNSPAWFLRNFRCEFAAICSEEADRLLDAARLTGFAPQRAAFFAEAERIMREQVLFIPIAAPIRWSLAGRNFDGFAENRFARHSLVGLRTDAGARN